MPSFYDSVNDCQLKQAALLWRDNRRSSCLRAVRRVYSRPASNIARSDRIGWPSEATRYADERSLGFAVLFRAVAALRAGARGISGVNEVDRHTTQLSFVGDKRPKLRECPRVECCALRPSSLHPRANVPEIFQHNRSLRAFGLRNNPFGQTVVDVFGKAALLTGQLPQAATATECAELLQLVPEPPVAVAHVLDRLPRMRLTVAIGRNVPDAQIDTERAVNINRIWRFNLARRKQIPVAAHECQIGFAAPGSEQLALPLTTDERYGLPPVECPDRDQRVGQSKREDAVIVSNRTVAVKGAPHLAIQFVGIRDFGDAAHGQLCGKSELLAHALIGQTVNRKLPKRLRIPCHLTDVVTGSIRRFKRALERIGLRWRGKQLQLYRQPHDMRVYTH